MFVFETDDKEVMIQTEEVSEFQWLDLNHDFKDGTLKESVKKFLEKIHVKK